MTTEQSSWRCSVCGYVHRGPAPPSCCSICGASASEFKPYAPPAQTGQTQPAANQWRCLNCSYVYKGSAPPASCPICGVASEDFEAIPDVEPAQGSSTETLAIVIIGAGIAGVSAAEAIRETSKTSAITLISSEPSIPYYRLNLTRYLANEIDVTALPIHPQSWYEEQQISLIQGQKITSLSTKSKTLILDNGETLRYDKLILAMGSHPFMPPLSGIDLDGVFSLRTVVDADAILARLKTGVHCVCIGGGILGLETAGALAERGGDVTLLESHGWLMPRQLTMAAAAILEKHMSGLGVAIRKNARTQRLEDSDGVVTAVILDDGTRIPCGLVVICTGVRSNTYLARKAGLDVDRGVIVDHYLTTSDPHILAAGDVAEYNGIVYGIWAPSQFQGTIAGLNAIGVTTQFGGMPRSNALKVLGIEMLSIGTVTPEDGSYRIIQEQNGTIFRRFVFRDSKMVGCILLGNTDIAAGIKHAIETKTDFSDLLQDASNCDAVIRRL